MAVNGIDVVEQLRGRMRFYHVGDPVRKDLDWACEEIDDLRIREMLLQALVDEERRRLDSGALVVDAASVVEWLDEQGIKLLPWQRKRMGLAPTRTDTEKQ
jgi:hypothetical protein